MYYTSVNRTLCPDVNRTLSEIVVTVSTASQANVSFEVLLYEQPLFRLDETAVTDVASPSMPVVYQFDWPEGLDYALIKFQSNDSLCTVVRAQVPHCPINDMQWNVKFEGSYQVRANINYVDRVATSY